MFVFFHLDGQVVDDVLEPRRPRPLRLGLLLQRLQHVHGDGPLPLHRQRLQGWMQWCEGLGALLAVVCVDVSVCGCIHGCAASFLCSTAPSLVFLVSCVLSQPPTHEIKKRQTLAFMTHSTKCESGRTPDSSRRARMPCCIALCGVVLFLRCGAVWFVRCVALCGVVWRCVALCGVVWRCVVCGVGFVGLCVEMNGI